MVQCVPLRGQALTETSGQGIATKRRWGGALLMAVYLFLLCSFLAEFEIQIEGGAGWAAELPTWRITIPAVTWIFGGRPVTGYHVFLVLFLFTIFHFPLLFGRPSFEKEAKILWALAIVAVVWDFLWFALNPSYGMTRYGAQYVWWVRRWLLGVPLAYFLGIAMSCVFWMLPAIRNRTLAAIRFRQWLVNTGLLIMLAAVVAGLRYAIFRT